MKLFLQSSENTILVWSPNNFPVLVWNYSAVVSIASLINCDCHDFKVHLLLEKLRVILWYILLLENDVFVTSNLGFLT